MNEFVKSNNRKSRLILNNMKSLEVKSSNDYSASQLRIIDDDLLIDETELDEGHRGCLNKLFYHSDDNYQRDDNNSGSLSKNNDLINDQGFEASNLKIYI